MLNLEYYYDIVLYILVKVYVSKDDFLIGEVYVCLVIWYGYYIFFVEDLIVYYSEKMVEYYEKV